MQQAFISEQAAPRFKRWTVTPEELKTAQDNLVQGLPEEFASVAAVNGALNNIQFYDLPPDYYQRYPEHIRAVTAADVQRVAQRYIDVDHLAIIIVGDREKIEQPLRATGIAPIVLLDLEGNPVK